MTIPWLVINYIIYYIYIYHIPLISHSYTMNIPLITKPLFAIPLLVGGDLTILKNDGMHQWEG